MDYYNKEVISDVELLGRLNKKFSSPLIDRSRTIKQNLSIVSEMPTSTTELKFADITDARAVELLEKASKNQRNICVSYSGGIDSTTALVSLLKHKNDYQDVEIITVMSNDSYYEYPEFYENHLKSETTVEWVEPLEVMSRLSADREKPCYIVTGEIGDQLFGSQIMFNVGTKKMDIPWGTFLSVPDYMLLKNIAEKNPFFDEDKSYGNFLWWINFTLKYQWVQLRMYSQLETVAFEDIIHFFDTEDYQKWAISNPMQVKFPDYSLPQTYKLPAKEYIFAFCNDLWYLKSKKKVPSLCKTVEGGMSSGLSRITEDFKLYKFMDVEYEVNQKAE